MGSNHPRCPELVLRVSPETTSRVFDRAGELIDKYGVATVVHGVLQLTQHSGETGRRQPAFEDRLLNAFPVLFAYLGDATEPKGTSPFGVRDVVGNECVHPLCHHKRWIGRQVPA